MAQDKDRKELLEEPDPITVALNRIGLFIQAHYKQLIMAGIALAVIVVSASGVAWYLNQAENKAAVMLDKAMARYETVQATGTPAELAAVKKDLQVVMDEYGHTDAADMAMVQYAAVSYESGAYADAIDAYLTAYDTFGHDARFRDLILTGLAYAYAGNGDTENAVNYFEKVVADRDAVTKDQALFNLGNLYGEMGKADKSRDAYEKIVSDYPNSMYYEPARMQLAG